MTRKNLNEYTQIQVEKTLKKQLSKRKIVPAESYNDVIKRLLDNQNLKGGKKR